MKFHHMTAYRVHVGGIERMLAISLVMLSDFDSIEAA